MESSLDSVAAIRKWGGWRRTRPKLASFLCFPAALPFHRGETFRLPALAWLVVLACLAVPWGRSWAQSGPDILSLSIRLTGTLRIEGGSIATVVMPADGTERLYRLGECLPWLSHVDGPPCASDQVLLVGIGAREIMIEADGRRYVIPMAGGEGGPVNIIPAEPEAKSEKAQTSYKNAWDFFPNWLKFIKIKSEIESPFQEYPNIQDQATAVPGNSRGNGAGFRFTNIREGSLFSELGIGPGDIVLKVNGNPLVSDHQALEEFTVFLREERVTVEVERKGRVMQLIYEIMQ